MAQFDLVIRRGRVLNPETAFDAITDIGIVHGRIAAIGAGLAAGASEIDATDLIVAPGFIDIHAHGQTVSADRMQALDGVTTALELEVGALPVDVWYDAQGKRGRVLNHGVSAAWLFARKAVMASMVLDGRLAPMEMMGAGVDDMRWSTETVPPARIEEIIALVRQGLDQGALGIGIPHGYAAGAGVKEMARICEPAAERSVPTFTHISYASNIDPQSSIEAYVKLIGPAGATGAHMPICHLNSTSLRDIEYAVELIRRAQAQGLPITTEAYPYGTGSTVLSAGFFMDPDYPAKTGTGYEAIQLVSIGRRFESREDLARARAEAPQSIILWHFLDIENPHDSRLLDAAVLFPGGAIVSDAIPWSNPDGTLYTGEEWPLGPDKISHPRSSGTFARFLGTWVRERQAVALLEAIEKCTLIPARIMEKCSQAFVRKGRLQAGCDADIVVFDLEHVHDRATFEQMQLPSEGMVHVLVNGAPVVCNGKLLPDARPGQPFRSDPR
ncbi:MAG: amidohydrolase family protein [Gemmobacter sp.]|jgi:N-acyl-D-glutamate deacylase|nr:amidohydrolase family protein [Gemmobacter sp.]